MLWPGSGLRNPCNPLWLGDTLLSNQPAGSRWTVLCTSRASFHWLPPSGLPSGLSAPVVRPVWRNQKEGHQVWLQGGDCSVARKHQLQLEVHPKLPFPHQIEEVCRWCSLGGTWLLSNSNKGDGLLGGSAPLHTLKSCADCFSDGLQDLIMSPTVLSFPQSPWAAAENVFHVFHYSLGLHCVLFSL